MSLSLISVVRDVEQPWKVFSQALKRCRPFVDEIVVFVDDRSKDNSLAIAKEHADIVLHEPLGGPAAEWGIQRTMEAATGDWMMWLADDELPSMHFLRALGLLTTESRRCIAVPLVWLIGGGRMVDCKDPHVVLWPRTAYQLSEIHSTVRGHPIHYVPRLPYWHFANFAPIEERKSRMNSYAGVGAHPQQGIERYLPEINKTPTASVFASRRW